MSLNQNSPTPDATTTTKGKLQLANDLAGTAALPVVAKINGVAITGTPSLGYVPTATSGTAATWQSVPTGFVDLGTATLGSPADTIPFTSIPAYTYLMVLVDGLSVTGNVNVNIRFNNDSGANYSSRISTNGGADSTAVSQTEIIVGGTFVAGTWFKLIANITNITAYEKLMNFDTAESGTAGAGNVTNRREGAAKWVNTASQISRIDIINLGAGDFATGTRFKLLGSN